MTSSHDHKSSVNKTAVPSTTPKTNLILQQKIPMPQELAHEEPRNLKLTDAIGDWIPVQRAYYLTEFSSMYFINRDPSKIQKSNPAFNPFWVYPQTDTRMLCIFYNERIKKISFAQGELKLNPADNFYYLYKDRKFPLEYSFSYDPKIRTNNRDFSRESYADNFMMQHCILSPNGRYLLLDHRAMDSGSDKMRFYSACMWDTQTGNTIDWRYEQRDAHALTSQDWAFFDTSKSHATVFRINKNGNSKTELGKISYPRYSIAHCGRSKSGKLFFSISYSNILSVFHFSEKLKCQKIDTINNILFAQFIEDTLVYRGNHYHSTAVIYRPNSTEFKSTYPISKPHDRPIYSKHSNSGDTFCFRRIKRNIHVYQLPEVEEPENASQEPENIDLARKTFITELLNSTGFFAVKELTQIVLNYDRYTIFNESPWLVPTYIIGFAILNLLQDLESQLRDDTGKHVPVTNATSALSREYSFLNALTNVEFRSSNRMAEVEKYQKTFSAEKPAVRIKTIIDMIRNLGKLVDKEILEEKTADTKLSLLSTSRGLSY